MSTRAVFWLGVPDFVFGATDRKNFGGLRCARFSRAVAAVKDTAAAEELGFRGDAGLLHGGCGDKNESSSRFEVEDHGCRLFSFFFAL